MCRKLKFLSLAIVWLVVGMGSVKADFVAHTDFASFNTAIGAASVTTVNFDNVGLNTVINNGSIFQGITFQYDIGIPTNLVVTNGIIGSGTTALPTTSGSQFLGSNGSGQLVAGSNNMTLSFSGASAVGMRIIVRSPSDSATLVGDLFLRSSQNPLVTAALPALPSSTLVDGLFTDRVYFLGLQNTSGLLTDLSVNATNIDPTLNYRIDDIMIVAVPEPSSLALLASAAAATSIGLRNRRRAKRS